MPTLKRVEDPNDQTTQQFVLAELVNAWSAWWGIVGSIPINDKRLPDVQVALRRFGVEPSPTDADRIVRQLTQGKYLVRSALEWHSPAIGSRTFDEASMTEKARGDQWRLVMAYAGLERLMKALPPTDIKSKPRGLGNEIIECFITRVSPPDYPGQIDTPPKQSIERLSNLTDRKTELKAFLHGRAVRSWQSSVCLAQGLRNSTAHGALFPSKVLETGLLPVFQRLALDIGRLVAACFRRLAATA